MQDNYLVVAPYIRYILRPGLDYEPVTRTEGKVYVVNNGVLRYIDNPNWSTCRIDTPDDVRTTLEYTGLINNVTAAVVFFDKSDNVISWVTNIPMDTRSTTFAIPAGTAYVMAPVAGTLPLPTQARFRLTFEEVDLTAENSVINWPETETVMERDGATAVFPESLPGITVAAHSEGYRVLQGLFRGSGMRAAARLAVYRRGNYDNEYTHVCTVPLSFETYNEAEESIIIGGVDASLNKLINSRGGIDYDIPVSELSPKTWRHTPLRLREWAEYTLPLDQPITFSEQETAEYRYFLPSVTLNKTDRLPGGIEYDMTGQRRQAGIVSDRSNSFVYLPPDADRGALLRMRLQFTLQVHAEYWGGDPDAEYSPDVPALVMVDTVPVSTEAPEGLNPVQIPCAVTEKSRTVEIVSSNPILPFTHQHVTVEWEYRVDTDAMRALLGGGDRLYFALQDNNTGTQGERRTYRRLFRFTFTEFGNFILSWLGPTGAPYYSVQVVEPVALLQKLLYKIQEGTTPYTHYTAEIVGSLDDRARIMLACGESLLRRPGAAFHCSLRDFQEWMHVMGWEYEIDGSVLRYRPRDYYFRPACPVPLIAEEVADLVISPDTSFAYTAVDIGYDYDPDDTDNGNGRADPMGTATYSTGLIVAERNTIELISPFRADPVGIDLLIRQGVIGLYGSDKDAKAIFAVALTDDPAQGLVDYMGEYMRAEFPQWRAAGTGTGEELETVDLFNAPLHPRMLVERNATFMGIAGRHMHYTGSTGNSRITFAGPDAVPGVEATQDVATPSALFRPIVYHFTTATTRGLPPLEARNVPIGFTWHGRMYAGFIKDIRRNIGDVAAEEWELWATDGEVCE